MSLFVDLLATWTIRGPQTKTNRIDPIPMLKLVCNIKWKCDFLIWFQNGAKNKARLLPHVEPNDASVTRYVIKAEYKKDT